MKKIYTFTFGNHLVGSSPKSNSSVLVMIVMIFMLSSFIQAKGQQTCTAISSGSWTNPLTWDGNAVPPEGSGIIIDGFSVTDVPNTTISSLEMTGASLSGSGTLKLTDYLTVSAGTSSISCNLDISGTECSIGPSSSSSMTISGSIAGLGGSIEKTGGGILTLSGANTFDGGVTLRAGQLNLNNTSALGVITDPDLGPATFTIFGTSAKSIDNTSGSAITINTNNPLVINSNFTFIGSSNLNLGSGNITVTKSFQITVSNSASNLTFGGYIFTNYNLTKEGDGTLAFTNNTNNNTLGSLTINKGTVSFNGQLNLNGDLTDNGNLINNGTLNLIGVNQIISGTQFPIVIGDLSITSSTATSISEGTAMTVNNDLSSNGKLIIKSSEVGLNGSLIVKGASTGNVTYARQLRVKTSLGDRHFFSSPVGSQDIAKFITSNSGKVGTIWGYDESLSDPENWPVLTSGTFASGLGYNLSQTTNSDGNYSFTGPLVSSKTVTATSPYATAAVLGTEDEYADRWENHKSRDNYGCGGWNLLGNPFTSAMNVQSFLTANSGSFDPNYKAIYVYDGTADKYYYIASIAPLSTLDGDLSYSNVQVGQGFWVLADSNNVKFSFMPGMQTHDIVTPMTKSAESEGSWAGLLLKTSCGNNNDQTTIIYNNDMKAGLDPGYDIGQFTSSPGISLYTALVQDNGINFSRQALPMPQEGDNIVALGVDSKEGGEVTFSAITVPLPGYQYYLEDRTAGTFTELGVNTYTVTLPANTFGTGRFFLHTKDGVPTGTDPDISDPLDMRIWAYGDAIMIQGAVSSKATCTVYNMQGNMIHNGRLTDETMNTVPMKSSAKGVYIVIVNDEGTIHRQKVVMF